MNEWGLEAGEVEGPPARSITRRVSRSGLAEQGNDADRSHG